MNRSLLSALAVATMLTAALPVASASADYTPAQRQALVESGDYLASVNAALAPARRYLIDRATPTAKAIEACTTAGFAVGSPDPGPDPSADYTTAPPAPVALRATAAKATPKQKAAAKKRAAAHKKAAAKKKRTKKPVTKRQPTTTKTPATTAPKAAPTPATQAPATSAPSQSAPETTTTPATTPDPVSTPVNTSPSTPDEPAGPTAADCAAIKPLAIALDQDETAMSSYRVGSAAPQYDPLSSIRNQALGTQTALEPVHELYELARSLHVSVFIITARFDPILADPSNNALYTSGALCTATYLPIGLCGMNLTTYDYRAVTADNLRAGGYTGLAGLYMRPAGSTDKGVTKAKQRWEIETRRGYDLLEMVGDNGSDVSGGYADLMVRIPSLDAP